MARYRLRLLLQEFDLPPGETILGRSPDCHVTIDDPLVSREHAKILVEGEQVTLHDLGSRNGSKVNGEPVASKVSLADGDRVRIGNQEIVFTHATARRLPGRVTGSLRYCSKCQTPSVAEAPQCPHCGYVPGADETLSGMAPIGNLDRNSWSLQMQVELLDKALGLQRLPDADRVLGRIAVAVDERMSAGMPLDLAQLEPAFLGALRLASQQGEIQWVRWVLSVLARIGRPPSRQVVDSFGGLPLVFAEAATKQLDDALKAFESRADDLDAEGRRSIEALKEFRGRLVQQSERGAPSGSS